ncbi:DNA translocase FtsK [Actinomadura rugatobispora]|uniref:DNA translocase FtsK n=1 Tax=Actinomadura rugatobispora TaxID=1994 RepID=A0ABW0ZNP9_9ACTN|nr:hypothetical protein GCM10010200_036740 [Actinomadura rugatobispora]
MARKQQLEVAQQEGLERIVVSAVSKVGVLVPPWIVLVLLYVVGEVSHQVWGEAPAVTWTTMAGTALTMLLTALTWAVSHHRSMLGRWHSTLTTGGAGMWFVTANIVGVTHPVTGGMAFFGGGALAIAWNIRAVIRQSPAEDGNIDALGSMFDRAKASFGLSGAKVKTTEVSEHKVKGQMALPAGEKTVEDVQKKTEYIESGMQFPPGSVVITRDKTDASKANITVTNPLVMDSPIPWPGPSRPGGSIADPLRVGIFQDSDPMEMRVPGNNLQIMGASGSGKSMGGGWNTLAEAMSRRDVAIFAVDLSKATQTLGPLEPGLHRLQTGKAGISKFIRDLHEEIPKRTKWLGDHDYNDWEPGCGLLYWLVLFEEIAKIFDELGNKDQELIEQITKEIRSAGGRVIMSLQRSTHGEMPTIIRSQMAFMCFGLNASSDAEYGLSERQQRAEVSPEMWGAGRKEHQGKAYLDADGVDDQHFAMPGRTFAWGSTAKEAATNMRAYAEQWPAASKDMDEFTARLARLPEGAAVKVPQLPPPASPGAAPRPSDGDQADDRDDDETEVDEAFAELLAQAAEIVTVTQHASTQMLQRKLRIGHEVCLRVMEALERAKIVGPVGGDGARKVLMSVDDARDVIDELREEGDPVSEYVRTEDPDPTITAGPSDPVIAPSPEENQLETEPLVGGRMSPEAARRLVTDWVRHRHATDRVTFKATDSELQAIRERTGNESRTWINNVLDRLHRDGVLEKEGSGRGTTFKIVNVGALDDAPVPA